MENIRISLSIVLPLVIYILVGAGIRKFGIVDESAFSKINRIIYYVGLPCVVGKSIYTCDFSIIDSFRFPLFLLITIPLIFLVSGLITWKLCKNPRRRGVITQCISRTNDSLFGIPIAMGILGESRISAYMISLAISIPLFNTLAVIVMEIARGKKIRPLNLLKNIVTNPIILGCIIGFLLKLLHITLPDILMESIQSLSDMVTPLAFIIIGGTIHLKSLNENRKALAVISLFRLLVIPLVTVGIGILLGFSNAILAAVLCCFGSPCASSTYAHAKEMDGDDKLAGEAVTVTSILAILSMFILITLFKSLGVI